MSTPTIASAEIIALEHPITALEDRPAMSADDLKAYFDANPLQITDAHNTLVNALTGPTAAASLGFSSTPGIMGENIQSALENVQQQLSEVALNAVPNASITLEKLEAGIQQQLALVSTLQEAVTTLQSAAAKITPSGAQFPLMIYVSSETCTDEEKDELSTAALGFHYTEYVHDLGMQLGWLCQWKRQSMPSEAFLAKQNMTEILSDTETLYEIANLPAVLQLIQMSTEGFRAYRNSMDLEE